MLFSLFAVITLSVSAQYGTNVGTSTSRTDSWGNTTTTHKDAYGGTIGTSTSRTDSWGNTTTQQKSNNNSSIWTW